MKAVAAALAALTALAFVGGFVLGYIAIVTGSHVYGDAAWLTVFLTACLGFGAFVLNAVVWGWDV